MCITESCVSDDGRVVLHAVDYHRGDNFAFHVIRRDRRASLAQRSEAHEYLRRLHRTCQASEYFSGARLPEELGAFLSARSGACRELGRALAGAERIYLVGSGGSWATLQTAKYPLDGYLATPIEALHGYDLIWRKPAGCAQARS